MHFRPMNDFVLVERAAAVSETLGGILIPENAKEKPREGTVKAVGPGRRSSGGRVQPPEVQEGDRVLFTRHGEREIVLGEQTYVLLPESQILAVLL